MQEFITRATAALGISDAVARDATGALLALVSKSASAGDVQQLLSKLPGAAELLRAMQPPAPEPPTSTGVFGALSGMVSSASSALGSMGPGALLQFLAQSGLTPHQGGQFATLFLDFARQRAGKDLVDQIANTIPGAKSFL